MIDDTPSIWPTPSFADQQLHRLTNTVIAIVLEHEKSRELAKRNLNFRLADKIRNECFSGVHATLGAFLDAPARMMEDCYKTLVELKSTAPPAPIMIRDIGSCGECRHWAGKTWGDYRHCVAFRERIATVESFYCGHFMRKP